MQLSSDQERRLRELMQEFLQENQQINLSAFRTEEACWSGNILDSLAGYDVLEKDLGLRTQGLGVLDIGTGGGFPLLPLAILHPAWSCTGMDSTRKKIDAVGRIVTVLGIQNVELVWGRCEELKRSPEYRGRFDIVTARAVADLSDLLPLMSPFAKGGGLLLCWKSMHCADEIAAAENVCKRFGCELVERHRYDLGEDFGERQILVYRKTEAGNGK